MQMIVHALAFLCGFCLDLILGDPRWMPHPVRAIGNLISFVERKTFGKNDDQKDFEKLEKAQNENKEENEKKKRNEKKEFRQGIALVLCVVGITFVLSYGVLKLVYMIHRGVGFVVETWMTYQLLATRCLKVESMRVYEALKEGNLEESRRSVSMIVGRDTACLDETGVAKAAIETVAENTSDGVIAPMIYTAIGGPVLGWIYKAVNTMDSMVGYKNDRYLYFGRAAAKLDDIVNYVPARLSAWFMIVATFISEKISLEKNGKDGNSIYSGKRAYRMYRRDCRNHASPNSAQTEAACAGALGLQLAGDARYFGKIVKKPTIGDEIRSVEFEDIRRANTLMYWTAWIGAIVSFGIRCLLAFV